MAKIPPFQNNFIAGMLAVLPLIGTILVLRFVFSFVNEGVLDPVLQLIMPYVKWAGAERADVIIAVKLLIFIIVLGGIALFGLLVKSFFIRKVISFGESIVMRIPLVNKVYKAIQQISNTFFSKRDNTHYQVVIVEYPRKGVYILGLMTTDCEGILAKNLPGECVNVFVPTTPNPTSGYLIMLPKKDVRSVDISVEDAMKIIVSGGVVTPEAIHANETKLT